MSNSEWEVLFNKTGANNVSWPQITRDNQEQDLEDEDVEEVAENREES